MTASPMTDVEPTKQLLLLPSIRTLAGSIALAFDRTY